MKYLSIDIETTGLDPKHDQILEVAAVVEHYRPGKKQKPVEKLPAFHCYIQQADTRITGTPYALSLHARIFRMLANPAKADAPVYTMDEMFIALYKFIRKHFKDTTVTVAGKNVVGFDIPFLREKYSGLARYWFRNDKCILNAVTFRDAFKFRHRAIDPGPMYLLPTDAVPPDLLYCLSRAGLQPTDYHSALGDAYDIIRLVRHKFTRKERGIG